MAPKTVKDLNPKEDGGQTPGREIGITNAAGLNRGRRNWQQKTEFRVRFMRVVCSGVYSTGRKGVHRLSRDVNVFSPKHARP